MTEKQVQRIFGDNVPDWNFDFSAVFELKLCKGTSIPFNAVEPHQVENLTKSKYGQLYHKISDVPVSWLGGANVRGTLPKPFDCFIVYKVRAFVVIVFYEPHKRKTAYFIDIDEWGTLQNTATKVVHGETVARKSATEEMLIPRSTFIKELKIKKKGE